jgi:hypothetical protein
MPRRRTTTMSADEQTTGKKGGKGRQATQAEGSEATPSLSSTRTMAAFRIPTPLHGEISREALSLSSDLTSFVNRVLGGFMHYFGLPTPVVEEALERDRVELGLGRFEYYQYVLFRRYELMARHGPGYDKPGAKAK